MSLETFIAFALFAIVGSVTPGPNNLMLAATGASFGLKRGLPALFGVAVGFNLMVGVVTLGLGSFISANPQILGFLRIGGILMLVWMAGKIATAPIAGDEMKSTHKPIGFFTAAAFQWINAKAWLVAVSATSTYFVASQSALSQSVIFTSVFFIVTILSCSLWLVFGAAAGRLLANRPRLARGFNVAMALLLLSSIWLMIA